MNDKEIGKGFYTQPKERGPYFQGFAYKGDWMEAILKGMQDAEDTRLNAMSPEEREAEREKKRIAENLRKLEEARKKVEYDLKYFTPDWEELYVGYVCEKQTSYGWQEGSWPSVLGHDTHFNLDRDEDKLRKHSRWLRCEYFTTQMLVMEGWSRTERDTVTFRMSDFLYQMKIGENQEVIFSRFPFVGELIIGGERLYTGRLKSINEYRKLLQMLNIKL